MKKRHFGSFARQFRGLVVATMAEQYFGNFSKGAINQVYQPVLIINIRSRGLKIKLRRKEAGKMARKVNTHIKAAVSLIINENLAAFRDFLFKIAYFVSKYVLRNHKPKRHNNSKLHNTFKASVKSQKKYQRID